MDQPEGPRTAVHCCTCNRLLAMPPHPAQGAPLTCPFCGQKQRLREMTVWVTDPLVEA